MTRIRLRHRPAMIFAGASTALCAIETAIVRSAASTARPEPLAVDGPYGIRRDRDLIGPALDEPDGVRHAVERGGARS